MEPSAKFQGSGLITSVTVFVIAPGLFIWPEKHDLQFIETRQTPQLEKNNRGSPAASNRLKRNIIMSIKSIALVAAAVVATSTAVSADNYFQFGERLDSSSTLDLGIVSADSAGIVEIYDFSKGEVGRLLGTEAVNAGANPDVRVNVGTPPSQDVIALLKVNGETVAERDFDIDR